MPHELIITEKPSAAKMIAEALADSKIETKKEKGIAYKTITHDGKTITIVSAVGHLFTVAEKEKSFKYPSFDIEWKPVYEVVKNADYAKKYADLIKKEAKESDSFVVACDYDVEGEVIGLNIIKYLCKKKDAKRMKFSTLTKPDLVEAYQNMSKTLDWGQANAGETRHFLDWLYGINTSRALMHAIKKTNSYKTMSSGRVQGPALRILAEREKEIQEFKPQKYWEIKAKLKKDGKEFDANHIEDKFWEKEKAEKVLKKIKDKKGTVDEAVKSEKSIPAPYPFDLTTLQTEAYRNFGISPTKTLEMAQSLYTKGYISYPRTSSQQLSEKIGFKRIITELMRQEQYSELGKIVLGGRLFPNNGQKTDPAHPAIYPTGIMPKALPPPVKKIYDLIAKRFLSTFGQPAVKENVRAVIDISSEKFVGQGSVVVDKGWHVLYEPYAKSKDEILPELSKDDKVDVRKIEEEEKETLPPKRYTEASIIKELEKRELGTKSTRAQIIQNLIDREYVSGKSLEVSKLGMDLIETLRKYCPTIIEDELTAQFDQEMEKIKQGKADKEKVIARAEQELTKILEHFKKHEKSIGEGLIEAYRETEFKQNFIGKCPVCKKGSLKITFSRKNRSRFIACDAYPDCRTTFSIPPGKVVPTEKECGECGYPMITVIAGKRPRQLCINPNCKTKQLEKADIPKKNEKCPKCGKGMLVLKQSVYGQFYACDRYPECRYIKSNGKNSGNSKEKETEKGTKSS